MENKNSNVHKCSINSDWPFNEFRKDTSNFGRNYGYKALDKFDKVENKVSFLIPTILFIEQEKEDKIRSWGISILEKIGGSESFNFIVKILNDTKVEKRKYVNTRFFALKAIANIANTTSEKETLSKILKEVWNDDEEDLLAEVGATIIIIINHEIEENLRYKANEKIKKMLDSDDFWPRNRILRVLREFPILDFIDDITSIDSTKYYYLNREAIITLGYYNKAPDIDNEYLKIIRVLGLIVRKNEDDSLRLEAVKSLSRLGYPESQEDLIHALQDNNAEVRVQASKAIKTILKDEAVPIIVQKALKEDIQEDWLINLIDSLRLIDSDRSISIQVLGNELTNRDQRRAKVAEKILLDLGGWAALQTISQRRNTLETLDRLLEKSENAVKDTFRDTVTQARRNFYFAMGVNIIIVIVGLFLVSVAISQLIQNSSHLETWIIPGGAGLFGILMTMFFNDPRKNAREDLTTLMNVNIIFLGFLRRLNQIDATFKHVYIESHSFGTNDMDKTIDQIDDAVTESLKSSEKYLRNIKLIDTQFFEEKNKT